MQNRVALSAMILAFASFAVSAVAQTGTATSPEEHMAQMERICRERHSLAQVPPKFERRCQSLELNRDAETLIAQTPEQRVEIYLLLKQGVQPEALAALGEQYQIEPLIANFTDYKEGQYQGGGGFNLGMFRGSWQQKFKLSDEYQRMREATRPPGLPNPLKSVEGIERLMTGATGYTTVRNFARLRSDPQVKSVSLNLKVSAQEYQFYRQRQTDSVGPPPGVGSSRIFGSSLQPGQPKKP